MNTCNERQAAMTTPEIQRYAPMAYSDGTVEMFRDERGDWVRLADHLEALEALREALKADEHDLREVRAALDGLDSLDVVQATELRRITDLIDGRLNGLRAALKGAAE